jgi:polysaccharide biosynthesis protein PslG
MAAGRRWFTAALAALLLLTSPAVAPAAPPSVPAAGWGFSQYGGDVVLSAADLERELDAVSATSASWLRVVFDAFRIETAPGQYNWGYSDMVVDAARAHGLNLLVQISYAPDWARPAGSPWNAPPTDDADFADFATAVVQRYGDRVSHWQIWNEPNSSDFFVAPGDAAARYTAILKAAYGAIKAVQPTSTVVAAGLSRAGQIPPPAFMAGMYAAGAKGSFDAAAMHPYVSPGGLAADSQQGWSNVARVHDVMAANGDGGKQIWMTELGAATLPAAYGVTEDEQARQITDVLAAAAATGYSGPAFVFTIRDAPGRSGNPNYDYGALLTADWRPKAAAGVLAR